MSTSHLSPGQLVGTYRIVRKIAHGGMGEVYEAWDEELQRRIAIKVLRTESSASAQLEERFKSEGRALARLRHPNVVMLHQLGRHEGQVFMAMEYIDGVSLDRFMVNHPCGLPDILKLFRQILEGLAAAHDAGIIHRDIKPQNIVVDKTMTAKLVDFGIAKLHADAEQVQTASNVLVGTVNYLSPEIVTGQEASKQSDIYSLGLVLFNMITGQSPFHGRSNLEVLEKIRSQALTLSPRIEHILPKEVKELIFRMTTRSLRSRYQEAREVLEALAKVNLDSLPDDLRLSVFPKVTLANAEAIRMRCHERGFDSAEIRFIMNLAADVQWRSPESNNSGEQLHITDESLGEAIRRFIAAKETLTGKRAKPKSAAAPKPPKGHTIKWVGFAATAVAAGLVLFFGSRQMRPTPSAQRSPASVPAPANEYPLPSYTVGQKSTYHIRLTNEKSGKTFRRTVEWTLTKNNGGKLFFSSGEGGEQMRLESPFLPPLINGKSVQSPMNLMAIDGDPDLLFPLSVGKTGSAVLIYEKKQMEKNWACTAKSEEKRRFAVGELHVILVECSEDGTNPHRAKYWYAPAVGRVVQSEQSFQIKQKSFILNTELVSYR